MDTITREREQELLAIFRDDDKMNDFISKLTGKDLKDYLVHINERVRDNDAKHPNFGYVNGGDRMCVGTHVAPRLIVRIPFFDKLVETLKTVDSRKEKAMLMYYFINELHPFYNGNGRTSRFLYDLLAYRNFDIQYSQDFKHWNDGCKVLFKGFEQSNNFSGTRNAFHYAGHFLRNYLIYFNILPDFYSGASTITTQTALPNNTNRDILERIYISNLAIKQGLSVEELTNVFLHFLSNETACSVSGLSVAVLLSHLNVSESKLAQYIGRSNVLSHTDNGISFWIDSKEEKSVSESVIGTWSREDYEKLIYFSDKLHEAMMETMLDIFEKPESFTINNISSGSQPILFKLMSADSDYFDDAPALVNSNFTPDTTTRVYSKVKQLRNFLDVNCPIMVPPTTSTKELWNQANPTLIKENLPSLKKPLSSRDYGDNDKNIDLGE